MTAFGEIVPLWTRQTNGATWSQCDFDRQRMQMRSLRPLRIFSLFALAHIEQAFAGGRVLQKV